MSSVLKGIVPFSAKGDGLEECNGLGEEDEMGILKLKKMKQRETTEETWSRSSCCTV